MDILEALRQIDALDDDNFTSDGSVKVDVVSKLVGRSVTRQDIISAAPKFNKQNPNVDEVVNDTVPKDAEGLKDPITDGLVNDTDPKDADGLRDPIIGAAPNDTEPKSAGNLEDKPFNPGNVSPDALDDSQYDEIDVSALKAFQDMEPMTEKDFVTFLYDVPGDNLKGLEEMLVEQQTAVEEMIARGEELRSRVRMSLGYTRSRIKREMPDVDNQSAIRAFITSQSQQRAIKAEKAAQVRSMIDVKDLDPRSTIDRAMARKTERGGKRPVKL